MARPREPWLRKRRIADLRISCTSCPTSSSGTISSALRLLSKKDVPAVDPDQDLLDKMDRKEGLSGPLPIAAGIAILSMAGAVAYFTLKLQLNASDAAVDVVMLVLIGSLALIAIFRSRFS